MVISKKFQIYSFFLIVIISTAPIILNLFGINFASNSLILKNYNISLDGLFHMLSGALYHALLEWSAVTIAMLTMLLSFVHYYIKKDITIPIIGMALFCAGIVDAFHTLAAIRIIEASTPNTDFIPFTWALSRTFNASIMIIAIIISLWVYRRKNSVLNIQKGMVIISIVSLLFISIAYIIIHSVVISSNLPKTTYPEAFITRPYDVLPLALFVLLATLVWIWYNRCKSYVKWLLILCIIPQIATQLHMALGSTNLFDNHFNIAHFLKIIAYTAALAGITIDLCLNLSFKHDGNVKNTINFIKRKSVKAMDVGKAIYPLGIKIPVAVFLITITTATIVGSVYHNENENLIIREEVKILEKEGKLLSLITNNFFNNLYKDIVFLSNTDELSNLINIDSDKYIESITNLEAVFSTMLYSNNSYVQIRFIGVANDGKEIVRIDKEDKEIIKIPTIKLQKKGHTEYFKDISKINDGGVYFSKIELNKELGGISLPHIAVFRAAVPVYDKLKGDVFGFVMININYGTLVERLENATPEGYSLYIANEDGDYLTHVNKNKTFGFDLGKRYLIQDEFTSIKKAINDNSVGYNFTYKVDGESENRNIAFYSTLNLNNFGILRPLRMLLVFDNKEHIESIISLRNRSLVIALSLSILAFILAVFGARRLILPLTNMTKDLQAYENTGNISNLPIDSKDEIGVLARSFHNVLGVLDQRTAEIAAILDSAADGIITIDPKGSIKSFNISAEEMFGYKESDLINKNINILMPSPFKDKHDSYLSEYLRTNIKNVIGSSKEVVGVHKNGRAFPIDLSVSEVKLDGVHLFTGIIRDISDRKADEDRLLRYAEDLEIRGSELAQSKKRAESANAAKGEFLANMSHEIRTPMNGIIGTASLLATTNLSDKQKTYIETIRNSSDILLQIINDILDLSKIEAGELNLEDHVFDLKQQVIDIEKTMSSNLSEGVTIELIWNNDVPEIVSADKVRIGQIFYNLISNAIKFTKQGDIKISVKNNGVSDQFFEYHVEVSDTGIGIPKDKISTIFDKFKQAEETTTRQFGGTGLGLAICKELVKAMDGKIGVKSEIGKGSIFWFTMKLKHENIGKIKKHHKIKDKTCNVNIEGSNILLAEDNDTNALIATDMLELLGCNVTHVENGAKAVEARRANDSYDVILMDCRMPEMDGYIATTKIREYEHKNKLRKIPIIALTANAMKDDYKVCFESGMDDYMSKPIKDDNIKIILNKWLEK